MTTEQAIKLMLVEATCIERASNIDHPCTRECEKCDLLQKDSDLIAAYGMAVSALRSQQWISVKDGLPENEEDAAPVVHGRWIKAVAYDFAGSLEGYKCNICGRFCTDNTEPYCHCGAKMDGGDNDAVD